MAWNESSEPKISAFNSAAFKMQRLHKILDLLNDLDANITAYNEEYQEYNYNIKFSKCENLYQEVESKLTSKEKIKIETLRRYISNFMEENQVFKVVKNKTYPYSSKKVLNAGILRILKDLLSKYESECRRLVDAHGMDTSYNEEEGLF
jgi:uncharacterized protein (DUF4415 family)|tara:strand:+ start:301 stop:747 length:447 start_codon:yes stop_codon:yes gene_type:complete